MSPSQLLRVRRAPVPDRQHTRSCPGVLTVRFVRKSMLAQELKQAVLDVGFTDDEGVLGYVDVS